jgi:hypothetical protein
MTTPADHPMPPRGHPPTATAELLPMLVWLNRRDLATRFPAWRPHGWEGGSGSDGERP